LLGHCSIVKLRGWFNAATEYISMWWSVDGLGQVEYPMIGVTTLRPVTCRLPTTSTYQTRVTRYDKLSI
jgi:hypothetical protein